MGPSRRSGPTGDRDTYEYEVGLTIPSPNTSAVKRKTSASPSQAPGGRPALTQVCRRNCSGLHPRSVATCGRSRPRRWPCSTTSPCTPIVRTWSSCPPKCVRVDRFERVEDRNLERRVAELGGGERGKARILARGIGRAAHDVGGELAAGLERPEAAAQLAVRASASRTRPRPVATRTRAPPGVARLATRAATDRRAKSIRRLARLISSASKVPIAAAT